MKLFHSWKRWQLIALVCVVLTAVLTLVFVLQGGSGDTQPTGSTEGLQLATETLGDVTEPPETAAPTEKPQPPRRKPQKLRPKRLRRPQRPQKPRPP